MLIAQKKQHTASPDGERIRPPERRDAKAPNILVFDAARAFGVMAGPWALFDLFLVGSVIATIRGALIRPRTPAARRLRPLVAPVNANSKGSRTVRANTSLVKSA